MINISLTVIEKACYINNSATRVAHQHFNSSAKRKKRLYVKNIRTNRFVDLLRRHPCNKVRVVSRLLSFLILLLSWVGRGVNCINKSKAKHIFMHCPTRCCPIDESRQAQVAPPAATWVAAAPPVDIHPAPPCHVPFEKCPSRVALPALSGGCLSVSQVCLSFSAIVVVTFIIVSSVDFVIVIARQRVVPLMRCQLPLPSLLTPLPLSSHLHFSLFVRSTSIY